MNIEFGSDPIVRVEHPTKGIRPPSSSCSTAIRFLPPWFVSIEDHGNQRFELAYGKDDNPHIPICIEIYPDTDRDCMLNMAAFPSNGLRLVQRAGPNKCSVKALPHISLRKKCLQPRHDKIQEDTDTFRHAGPSQKYCVNLFFISVDHIPEHFYQAACGQISADVVVAHTS